MLRARAETDPVIRRAEVCPHSVPVACVRRRVLSVVVDLMPDIGLRERPLEPPIHRALP